MAASLFCSWDFSFCMDTTIPVGRCVMRTAESVVLTDWPPAPQERKTSMRRSPAIDLTSSPGSSTSGMTSTPAAHVWMRPCDSVTGHALDAVDAALVLQVSPHARRRGRDVPFAP